MRTHLLKLILTVSLPTTFLIGISILVIFILCKRRRTESNEHQNDVESPYEKKVFSGSETEEDEEEEEELNIFEGGEDLTICDVLEAPGEVVGKSSYGTLYKASLQRSGKVRVLRFLRPLCAVRSDPEEFDGVVESLGFVRHDNLVPLLGFYVGSRGEKLMIHPFFDSGNLSEFIRCGDVESHKWINVLSITTGIAKALDHLHTGMQKPIVHGNLKSKNVLLDQSFRPRVSDFGLHLLLNLAAGQEVLEASAVEGYKAPELIKMKEVSKESDVYSFGVIMLELVSSKLPTNKSSTSSVPLDNEKLLGLCRSEILGRCGEEDVTKEYVVEYIELAMSCCSPSPSLRPSFKQVLRKLEEIKK